MIKQIEIQPVILTYAKSSNLSEMMGGYPFGLGYDPILVVDLDQDNLLHREVVSTWDFRRVYLHPYEYYTDGPSSSEKYYSVQGAAWYALNKAYILSTEDKSLGIKYVLWLEDDLEFSSEFVSFIQKLEVPQNTGFISFYLPASGHSTRKRGGYLDNIDPNKFYGTQCLLFPIEPLGRLLSTQIDARNNIQPGWDIQWSRQLHKLGYKLYESNASYIQHIGKSNLHPEKTLHTSAVFIK